MLKKTALLAALVTSFWALPSKAEASTFIGGDTIECSTNTFDAATCSTDRTQNPAEATVGDGVEFSSVIVDTEEFPGPKLFFDFSENGLLSITAAGDIARDICCTDFFFENLDKRWASFEYLSGAEIPVTLTDGVLRFNFRGFSLDRNFTSEFQLGAVPEPGTWLLMILGLGAVGFSMRRRREISDRLQFA